MAAEYTDANVPVTCSECDEQLEGIQQVLDHILAVHPNYTPAEAAEYARIWVDGAYEDIDLANMRLTEEYRRNHPRG